MRNKLRKFFNNPIVIILPIVGLLLWGWQYYASPIRNLSTVNSDSNLLPGGAFEQFAGGGIPPGWQLTKTGESNFESTRSKGYLHGSALAVTVNNYKNGDVTLVSPQISVQPNQGYLYKGYYSADTDFDLLVRYYYNDGSQHLDFIRQYPANEEPWTTFSTALKTDDSIQSVQFMHRIASDGTLNFDDTYLGQKNDLVYIAPKYKPTQNLIPNPSLNDNSNNTPKDWVTYRGGNNKSDFSYRNENNNSYTRVTTTDFKDGEAKWQYQPQQVTAGQYYHFSADYQSNTRTRIVVEYVLEDNKRHFETIASLKPAGAWTRYNAKFETPTGAKNMFVALVISDNGTLNTDNYALSDITKPGPLRYKQPLVSLTFDDAWQSAYLNGASRLDKYGYKGTFYLNSSTIDTGIFMHSKQLEDLKGRGHQLAAHGHEHLDMTTINTERLNSQLKQTHDLINEINGPLPVDFSTPYGRNDAEVQWYMRKYYRSHRGTESGINTKQTLDRYDLKVLFIGDDTPIQKVHDAIKQAKEYNSWLILVYHRIEDGVISSTTVTPATFAQHLEIIKQSGIPVKTVDGALNELDKQ